MGVCVHGCMVYTCLYGYIGVCVYAYVYESVYGVYLYECLSAFVWMHVHAYAQLEGPSSLCGACRSGSGTHGFRPEDGGEGLMDA